MKGQYRIVMEVMLFAIGVGIASFVFVTFQDVQQSVADMSVEDQLNAVLNKVSSGILKVSLNENSVLLLEVPETISGEPYRIEAEGGIITATTLKSGATVSKEIFNTEEGKIMQGSVTSATGKLKITHVYKDLENKITIQRD